MAMISLISVSNHYVDLPLFRNLQLRGSSFSGGRC